MGGDTIKYLTCNSDAFRVTMVDKIPKFKSGCMKTTVFVKEFVSLRVSEGRNDLKSMVGYCW